MLKVPLEIVKHKNVGGKRSMGVIGETQLKAVTVFVYTLPCSKVDFAVSLFPGQVQEAALT